MKYVWIKKHTGEYELKWLCRMLGVSVSSYRVWLYKPELSHKEQKLLEHIRQAVIKSKYSYGYRRVCLALRHEGLNYGYHTVRKMMAKYQFHNEYHSYRRQIPKTTDSQHHLQIAPNHLNQCFDVEGPKKVWVTDITYLPLAGRWVYLASIKDVFSAKIVGWAVQEHMEASLVIEALQMAIRHEKPPKGLWVHSDRGSQYCSTSWLRLLKKHRLIASMSRKANCYDNAPMESFWRTLKTECRHMYTARSLDEIRRYLFEYIHLFYNSCRIHSRCQGMSPMQFERLFYARLARRAP